MGGKTSTSGQGRPRGVPNKSTKAVKEALELAFEGVGGVKQLTAWAKANETEFFKLWVKMLPAKTEVTGEDGAPIKTQGTVDIKGATEEQLRVLASLPVHSG